MPFEPGLVHTPLTPFSDDRQIDFEQYGWMIEFHLRHGAQALAVPMHVGESVSLTDEERRALIQFAVDCAGRRAPVIAHVSDAGTGIAAALARAAQDAGAAAIVATTPYYWTPPPAMVLEHFAIIGGAVTLPLFVHNAPDDMAGSKVSAELMVKLIGRLDNFTGLIDQSLDWQFMIELMTLARKVRPDFQLIAGNELFVSPAAIRATGMLAPLAGIAPKLIRSLYEACRGRNLFTARAAQEEIAALRQAMKPGGAAVLKAAARAMGRDCGEPRPPLTALDAVVAKQLADTLAATLGAEPRGW